MNRKVLIISRGFRAGDAITTLNLFAKWPKDSLFCASMLGTEFASEFSAFYLLGNDEIKFSFPFSFLTHIDESVIVKGGHNATIDNAKRKSLKRSIYENMLLPVLQRLDLYETRYKMRLSDKLAAWINEISPDIIYTSVGDIPMANFILEVHRRFPEIKIAVHCFDDWLSPTYKIINESKHNNKAEILLNEILSIAAYRFTSSDKMASEYKERYGYTFRCFPNPVRLSANDNAVFKSPVPNVVFAGKIGWHNNLAIKDMISCIENVKNQGSDVRFDIYSDCTVEQIEYFLGEVPMSTVFHKPVPNKQILNILNAAHALFLPISITEHAEKFTRYSMSTKMGEYLSTGVPTIYCGPSTIAMTEFIKSRKCAIAVENPGPQYLESALRTIIENNSEISAMCNRGIELAKSYFNMEIVSQDFANELNKEL